MSIILENGQVKLIRRLTPGWPNHGFACRNSLSIKEIHWLDFPEPNQTDGGFAVVIYYDESIVLSHWRMKEIFENYFQRERPQTKIQYH